jgi:hypothetical protein
LHRIDPGGQSRYLIGQTFRICFLGRDVLSRRLQRLSRLLLKGLKILEPNSFHAASDYRRPGWLSGKGSRSDQITIVKPKEAARGGDGD